MRIVVETLHTGQSIMMRKNTLLSARLMLPFHQGAVRGASSLLSRSNALGSSSVLTQYQSFREEARCLYRASSTKYSISSVAFRAWDMVRSASVNPPNPLLPEEQGDTVVDFSGVRPHHLVAAAKQVQQEYMANFQALEEALHNDPESISADWLVGELENLESPLGYVHNVAALYQSLMQFPDWESAAYEVNVVLDEKPHEKSHVIMEALACLEKTLQADSSNASRAIRHHLSRYRQRGIQHSDESVLQEQRDSLEAIEARFVKYSDSASRGSTRQKLEDMYAMITLKTKCAKLLGYDNYADYVLAEENRMVNSTEEITSMHNLVKNKFSNAESTTFIKYADTQQHLSLDGVLLGMFGLARALFGILFHEADASRGWNTDVRLFSVVDEESDQELGNLYLDPYFRGTKARYFFLSPLDHNSVFLAAPIKAPAWDDMPAPMRFEDTLSLVHEFGHVLQFMLASKSGIATQYMPQDVSEVMPQLMEHFLFEEPVLQTIAHLSGSEPLPAELIQQLREQRLAEKVYSMNQRAFLGQLEIELFSDRNESLVSLQRRIAQEYVPHNAPDKNDIAPLIKVMSNNANGRHMCQYRYLWGEFISADIYCQFQDAGIEDQQKMRELGMRLRKTMLEPGGLVDGALAFAELLGREIKPDALFEMYTPREEGEKIAEE